MEQYPILKKITLGWAAIGKGWAVHGATQEEALEKYRDGVRYRQELDALPEGVRHPGRKANTEGASPSSPDNKVG